MSKKVEAQAPDELREMEAFAANAETSAEAAAAPPRKETAAAPSRKETAAAPSRKETAAAPSRKESLLIPLDPNGANGGVFLCVNGRNLLVKRGEPVQVAPEFAEAYRNAQRQQLAAMNAQRAAVTKE